MAGSPDREIVITRIIEAPRDLVYAAFTDGEHIAQWWGPRGFRNTIHEMDVRVGGVWRYMMHGPDGTDYPNRISYLDVVEPERLVYLHDGDVENDPKQFHVTVTFEESGGKTQLTLRLLFASAEACEAVKKFGAVEGGNQTIDRLGEFVATTAPGTFSVSRVFGAPRDLVYRTLTEPEHLAHWWGSAGCTLTTCKVDLRRGGEFLYCMHLPNGMDMWGKWFYRDVMAGERIVYVVSFCDENGNITRHPYSPEWPLELLSTITFQDEGDGTRVTMNAVPLNATENERKTFEAGRTSFQKGFLGTWDNLAAYLAKLG